MPDAKRATAVNNDGRGARRQRSADLSPYRGAGECGRLGDYSTGTWDR